MITGAHTIIYSSDAEADKKFFKEVLKFPYADAGHGWLIFGLPESELAIHPAEKSGQQEFYLLCDDVNSFIAEMAEQNIACSSVSHQRWGSVTHVTLPGGGKIGVYEPKHPRP